ncbi:hypothetical protein M569_10614, partial [Genlisea aurea]
FATPMLSPATSATTSGRTSSDSDEILLNSLSKPPVSRQYKPLAVLSGHDGAITCLALCGEFILSASRGDDIIVWQQPDLRQFARFGRGDGAVKSVVSYGDRVFTAHQDSRIRVWRVTANSQNVFKLVNTLPTAKDYLGKFLNQSNYVQSRRHHKHLWIEHSDSISCLEVSNEVIYSGSWDKTLKVWRLSDFKCLESINAHDDAINCLASRNGILYSASADGKLKAWKKRDKTHELRGTLSSRGESIALNSVVVSHDGRLIYAGCSDGSVICWNSNKEFDSWEVICEIKAHPTSVLCMCLEGKFLCCGSADKTISVWKIGDSKELSRYVVIDGHEGPVKCLQSSSWLRAVGGFMVYSGSIDKSLRVWWI